MGKMLLCVLSIAVVEMHAANRETKQEELITFAEMLKSPKQQPQTDTDDRDFDGLMLPKPPMLDHDYDQLLAQNPTKFKAALRRMTTKNRRSQPTRGRHHAMVDMDAQRAEIQEAIHNLQAINDRLRANGNALDDAASIPWNSERKKRLATASFWALLTGAALGGQAYIVQQNFSAETKIATAIPLVPTAFESLKQSIQNITDVINNTPIDKKIEENSEKIKAVQEHKRELQNEIDNLQEQNQSLQDRVSALEARMAFSPLAE